MVAQWPEKYKLAIDKDVVVLFPPAQSTAEWIGVAFIHHIPSVSKVILYPVFGANPRDYKSEEGRQRLEAVLADQALMQRILERIPDAVKSGRDMFDSSGLKVVY